MYFSHFPGAMENCSKVCTISDKTTPLYCFPLQCRQQAPNNAFGGCHQPLTIIELCPLLTQLTFGLQLKLNSKEAAKIVLTSFSFFSISACSFSQAAMSTSLYSSQTTQPSVLGRRTESSVSYQKKKKGSKCLLTQPN